MKKESNREALVDLTDGRGFVIVWNTTLLIHLPRNYYYV